MTERASIAKMLGEALRDVGVLVLVFFPLDQVFAVNRLTFAWIVATIVIGVGSLSIGIALERVRTS